MDTVSHAQLYPTNPYSSRVPTAPPTWEQARKGEKEGMDDRGPVFTQCGRDRHRHLRNSSVWLFQIVRCFLPLSEKGGCCDTRVGAYSSCYAGTRPQRPVTEILVRVYVFSWQPWEEDATRARASFLSFKYQAVTASRSAGEGTEGIRTRIRIRITEIGVLCRLGIAGGSCPNGGDGDNDGDGNGVFVRVRHSR